MFTPSVKVEDREFRRAMGHLERQMPYATARALTSTALDAQTVVKARLSRHFSIRAPWVARGIRIDPAKKNRLYAEVGSVDEFMRSQATGGVEKGRQAIPMVGKGRPRPNVKAVTRKSRWPGALLKKPNTFVGSPFGRTEAVWERIKKGKGKAGGLRLLYTLPESVKIPKRWPLQDEVREVVAKRWADHTASAIKEALDTAR